jgi:hypothetical protein
MLFNTLRKRIRRLRTSDKVRRVVRTIPRLEGLEGRLVPSSRNLDWVGGGDNTFNDPSHWKDEATGVAPASAPDAEDHIHFKFAGGATCLLKTSSGGSDTATVGAMTADSNWAGVFEIEFGSSFAILPAATIPQNVTANQSSWAAGTLTIDNQTGTAGYVNVGGGAGGGAVLSVTGGGWQTNGATGNAGKFAFTGGSASTFGSGFIGFLNDPNVLIGQNPGGTYSAATVTVNAVSTSPLLWDASGAHLLVSRDSTLNLNLSTGQEIKNTDATALLLTNYGTVKRGGSGTLTLTNFTMVNAEDAGGYAGTLDIAQNTGLVLTGVGITWGTNSYFDTTYLQTDGTSPTPNPSTVVRNGGSFSVGSGTTHQMRFLSGDLWTGNSTTLTADIIYVDGNGSGYGVVWHVGETPGLSSPQWGITSVTGDIQVRNSGTLSFQVGANNGNQRDELLVSNHAYLSDTGISYLKVTLNGTQTVGVHTDWSLINATNGFNNEEFGGYIFPTGMTHSKSGTTYTVGLTG